MTITPVSSQEYTFNSGTGQTTHTISASTGTRTHGIIVVKNNVLLGSEVSGVTWSGSTMTEAVESGSTAAYTEIWAMVEFGGGTQDVVVSFPDTNAQRFQTVIEWYDSDNVMNGTATDTDFINATTEDPTTLTMTTVVGDLVVTSYTSADDNVATASNQTLTQDWDQGANVTGAGYLIADGTSEAVAWDRNASGISNQFAMAAAVFTETAGGGDGRITGKLQPMGILS